MGFDLNAFRSKLSGGGARPNQFKVLLTPPSYVGFNVEQMSFMCKSAQLPSSTVGTVEVPYFGRRIKLGGNRVFDDWVVSIYNDEAFDLRNAFERWQSSIASHTTRNAALRGLGATSSPASYVASAEVQQLGKEGDIIKRYKFVNVFPTVVGAIELDWEADNQIEMFQVNLTYDYFETVDGVA